MIALSFDDGPNDPYTSQILELLDSHGVRATFFFLGKHVVKQPQTVKDARVLGNEIGNHGFNHVSFSFLNEDDARLDLVAGDDAILEACGLLPTVRRAPFGNVPEWMKNSVGWDVHGNDWETQNPEEIVSPIFKRLDTEQDSIVLLHDGSHRAHPADRSGTVAAVSLILGRYPKEQFCTVSEWKSRPLPTH